MFCAMKTGAADHRRILSCAREWAGAPLAIATVVETWNSAPCPLGAHMLIHIDGRFAGSVSGGCVEGDVLETAQAVMQSGKATLRRYGIAEGAAWEAGLPCGGDIVVLIQSVCTSGFPEQLFKDIASAHVAGESLSITTHLDLGRSAVGTTDGFINHYPPPRRLLIIGAVEIAQCLAPIAIAMGIDVTVIDPRARFLTEERFPGVVLDDRWPDVAVRALRPDARTSIITLSHDPKIDDPTLIAALESPAGYIGALGSHTSQKARQERLLNAGVSPENLSRLEGPAGVAINSISAPEIALSIAGGMIRALNRGWR